MKVRIIQSFAGLISHSEGEIVDATPGQAKQWIECGWAVEDESPAPEDPAEESARPKRRSRAP